MAILKVSSILQLLPDTQRVHFFRAFPQSSFLPSDGICESNRLSQFYRHWFSLFCGETLIVSRQCVLGEQVSLFREKVLPLCGHKSMFRCECVSEDEFHLFSGEEVSPCGDVRSACRSDVDVTSVRAVDSVLQTHAQSTQLH